MADDNDQSQKTEQPTPHKLRKLREQGNVPTSREVNNLFAILGMLILVGLTAPWGLKKMGEVFAQAISTAGTTELENASAIGAVLSAISIKTLLFLLPVLLVLLVLGYIGSVIQNGPIYSTESIGFKWEKVSPIAGWKRIFSLRGLAEFVKAIFKVIIIGAAVGVVFYMYLDILPTLPGADIIASLTTTYRLLLYIVGAALAIMLLLAAADFAFQRYQWIQQNMMSLEEVKREYKEQEGDPHIKAQRRRIAIERLRKRMMQAVPSADVIITNPTHYSIALRYKPAEGDDAPVLVAKGMDHIAMRIREIAKENNIPFYEDPPLARSLYKMVEVDQPIPVDMYEAVARVISFVMKLRKNKR